MEKYLRRIAVPQTHLEAVEGIYKGSLSFEHVAVTMLVVNIMVVQVLITIAMLAVMDTSFFILRWEQADVVP